ncbi:MAG: hypothetical protein FWG02_00540 [Holophagaceae bacterium]|nr:hypothetical protein [Holophagaceae bacterium]
MTKKTYLEETLKFIESEEMRNYLRTRPDEMDGKLCAKVVSYAPVPLAQKIEVLELIAKQTEHGSEWSEHQNPAVLARCSRAALDERYNNIPPGSVFLLKLRCCHHRLPWLPGDTDNLLATDFDVAIRMIKEHAVDGKCAWCSIEKYVPGDDGVLKQRCVWVLNAQEQIWYFDYLHEFQPEGWVELTDFSGAIYSPALPTPFTIGDIVLADCRPFAMERRVLIIRNYSDELLCLFMLPSGKISYGEFSYNSFLRHPETSFVSGFYRAMHWTGELPKHEKPLAIISKALLSDPPLGEALLDFIRDNGEPEFSSCYLKDPLQIGDRIPALEKCDSIDIHYAWSGPKWRVLKNEFGL